MKAFQEQLGDFVQNHETCNTLAQGVYRTPSERLDLIHQVFERCKRLKLQAPMLSDLDDYLDGRTSVMPPVVLEKSNAEITGADRRPG